MTLRKIQLSTTAVILSTLFLATGVTHSTGRNYAARNVPSAKASAPANWTFEGCWSPTAFGTCRDIFRDSQGNYYICRDCGTTGNPTPGKCNPISQTTLASGFWCS